MKLWIIFDLLGPRCGEAVTPCPPATTGSLKLACWWFEGVGLFDLPIAIFFALLAGTNECSDMRSSSTTLPSYENCIFTFHSCIQQMGSKQESHFAQSRNKLCFWNARMVINFISNFYISNMASLNESFISEFTPFKGILHLFVAMKRSLLINFLPKNIPRDLWPLCNQGWNIYWQWKKKTRRTNHWSDHDHFLDIWLSQNLLIW